MFKYNLLIKSLFLTLAMLLGSNIMAQITDTDSTIITEIPENAEEIHSPKKAALLSLLPGLGQAYNKKYWKIPIVYAGLGGIGYFMGWNNKNYQVLKIAYSDFTDGDPLTDSYLDLEGTKYYDLESESGRAEYKSVLNKQQDYYRRNRDLLVISMAAFYALNIIDASVDAHLFDFDISEDLSFNWQPSMNTSNKELVYGFNASFNF